MGVWMDSGRVQGILSRVEYMRRSGRNGAYMSTAVQLVYRFACLYNDGPVTEGYAWVCRKPAYSIIRLLPTI